jgi:hypothetical protein
MVFGDGRLQVVGIGGTLRGGSTSLGALQRALTAAEGLNTEKGDVEDVGVAV